VSEEQVRLAIQVPEDLVKEIDQFSSEHKAEGRIETHIPSQESSQNDEPLGFDPVTGEAFVWVALKFIGPAAASLATKLLVNALYERLKGRAEKDKKYELTVRFPTGEVMTLRTDEPLNLQEIRDKISNSGVR